MRLLIVTLHYLPDGGPSASQYAMLAETAASAGHDVTVVAASPHYPTGRALPGWTMPPDGVEIQNGVRVVRVAIPHGDRAHLGFRTFQFVAFQLRSAVRLLALGQFDAAIFANPALQVWLPWQVARPRTSGRLVFSIHDVYPDVGERLGIFRWRPMRWLVGAMESHCIRTADSVRILAPAFAEPARRLGADPARVRLIYDWADTETIRPAAKDNALRKEFGLSGKFVFMYVGNIGLSQGLESIVETSARFTERSDVRFVVVGEGAGLASLKAAIASAGARNIVLIPFQPRERLPEVFAAADVGLVLLQKGLRESLPSKVYSILASGRPVLASVDERNDMVDVIARAGAGITVPPEDPTGLAAACEQFLAMSPGELAAMGLRGRRYVEEHHSPEVAARQFLSLLGMVGASAAR